MKMKKTKCSAYVILNCSGDALSVISFKDFFGSNPPKNNIKDVVKSNRDYTAIDMLNEGYSAAVRLPDCFQVSAYQVTIVDAYCGFKPKKLTFAWDENGKYVCDEDKFKKFELDFDSRE